MNSGGDHVLPEAGAAISTTSDEVDRAERRGVIVETRFQGVTGQDQIRFHDAPSASGRIGKNKSVLEKTADSMSLMREDLGTVKKTMEEFMTREDRDAGMDKEVPLPQYLPNSEPTHELVLRHIAQHVRKRKRTNMDSGLVSSTRPAKVDR